MILNLIFLGLFFSLEPQNIYESREATYVKLIQGTIDLIPCILATILVLIATSAAKEIFFVQKNDCFSAAYMDAYRDYRFKVYFRLLISAACLWMVSTLEFYSMALYPSLAHAQFKERKDTEALLL